MFTQSDINTLLTLGHFCFIYVSTSCLHCLEVQDFSPDSTHGRGPPAVWRRPGGPRPGRGARGAVLGLSREGRRGGPAEGGPPDGDAINRLRTLCFPKITLPSQSYASPTPTEPFSRRGTHGSRPPPRANCRGYRGPRPQRPSAPTTPASPAPPWPTPPPRARLPQPGRP